jgi:hypothetical protein
MKLELKHLSPYLPYGLLCTAIDRCFISHPLEGLHYRNDLAVFDFENGEQDFRLNKFKPVLRPLSDLNKHAEIFSHGIFPSFIEDILDGKALFNLQETPYCIYIIFLENHYDVFGLIGAGLAIDINTLK